MRDTKEVERVFQSIANKPESLGWVGDSFKYGLFIGKVMALEWVLDQLIQGGEICIDYDYHDYRREQKNFAEDLLDKFRDEEGNPRFRPADDGQEDQTE